MKTSALEKEESEKEKTTILDIIDLTKRGYLEWHLEENNLNECLSLNRKGAELLKYSMLNPSVKFITFMPFGKYASFFLNECLNYQNLELEIFHSNKKKEFHIDINIYLMSEKEILLLDLFYTIKRSIHGKYYGQGHIPLKQEPSDEDEKEK